MTSEAKAVEPPGSSREQTSRYAYLTDREWFLGPVMLLPAIIYIAALVGFPLVLAVAYAFSDVTVGDQSIDWVGFDNFEAIWDDPTFRRALTNTFLFTGISMVLMLVLAKILATALSVDFAGKWFVRFLILLPWTTPISLGTIGWLWLLDSVFSPIDWTLREIGVMAATQDILAAIGMIQTFGGGTESNLSYLGREKLAMAAVILVHVWRMLPLATVILLAGASSIPQDIRDAAAVDGAGFWRRQFEIEIPMTLPIIAVAFLFGVVFTFTDMTVVYVLTRGGPIDNTQVLASWAYFKGIEGGSLAQGAAIALFLFPVLAGVAAVMLRLARRAEVT